MAGAATSVATGSWKLDKSMALTIVVAFVIIALLMWAAKKWLMPVMDKPAGALTQSEYEAKTAEEKALYKKEGDYWVKAA